MNSQLIEKATELRNKGLTTGEIADELNISKDTTQWLIVQMSQKTNNKQKQKPDDFAINWRTIGSSSTRMQYISAALASLIEEEVDAVVGITVSGVPFATVMADYMDAELAVFHPIKHMKNESSQGAMSNNFANIKNKNVVIVDDVITSGKTITDAINVCKTHGAKPVAVTVLVDKKGLNDLNNVPIKSLIKINKVG